MKMMGFAALYPSYKSEGEPLVRISPSGWAGTAVFSVPMNNFHKG
jgi:hypothetical protein